MRKLTILTSILALAACSSGGGGGHNPGYAHGAASTPVTGPTFTDGIYTNTENNDNVTQMKTQVIVDSNGHSVAPTLSRGGSIRSGSIQDTNGNSYNVYDLEDVKLNVADENAGWLKIGLADDGAIKDITLSSGGVESQLAREGTTNQFRGPIFEYVPNDDDRASYRIVDGTDFGEFVNIEGFADTLDDNGHATMATLELIASNKNLTGGHWNYIDERMDVTTNKHINAGNSNAVALQYSDFGHFNPVYRSKHTELDADVLAAIREYGADIEAALLAGNTTEFNNLLETSGLDRDGKDKYRDNDEFAAKLGQANYQLFAGGYAIGADGQLIEGGSFDAPVGATFTGTGVGRVYTSIHANADGTEDEYKNAVLAQYGITGDGHDIVKSFTTSSAQLTVDASGNQTLEMVFPDFYTVTATQTAGGVSNVTLTADNDKLAQIEKQYRKTGDVALPDYGETPQTHQVTSNGTAGDPEVAFIPGYYGVGSVSEAAGLVRYAEETNDIEVTNTTDPDNPEIKNFTREFEFQGAYGMKKD